VSSRRGSWRKNRDIANASIREALAVVAEVKAGEESDRKARAAAAREAEKARPKLTAEDVQGARFVRDEYGWHKVVRMNAKSVTVETGYSWTDRIPLGRILEVRK
jgi:CRISPR/Cas system CMR subunit Cmr4 (Cas7 group RAMP superfamily)